MPGYAKRGDWELEHMGGKDIKGSDTKSVPSENFGRINVSQFPTSMS